MSNLFKLLATAREKLIECKFSTPTYTGCGKLDKIFFTDTRKFFSTRWSRRKNLYLFLRTFLFNDHPFDSESKNKLTCPNYD